MIFLLEVFSPKVCLPACRLEVTTYWELPATGYRSTDFKAKSETVSKFHDVTA
jgi:hypothetical protein